MKKKTSRSKKINKKKSAVSLWFKDLDAVVKVSFLLSFILVFWAVYAVKADNQSPIVYVQDFEDSPTDEVDPTLFYNYDWFLSNSDSTNQVIRQGGDEENHYGIVNKEKSYSNFGACEPGGSSGIWLTQIDVYLDTDWHLGAGFDYSVETYAASPDGKDYMNYIFHVTKDTSTKKLLIGGSDQVGFSPREDLENMNSYVVKKSGWFTLRTKLIPVGYSLAVNMFVLDEAKKIVWEKSLTSEDFSYNDALLQWACRSSFPVLYNGYTINDPESDLPYEDPGFDLPIDNHKLVLYNDIDVTGPPETKDECMNDGWKVFDWETFTEPTFKTQGDCVSYVESNEASPGN